uniref:Mitochondrial import receptor subunit TOM20 homolog n=1 Tax=Vombatus ursinus TaxID=29139 RepID=A0A4X2JXJ2_VOMUR
RRVLPRPLSLSPPSTGAERAYSPGLGVSGGRRRCCYLHREQQLETWWAGVARSPPACAGPSSSATVFTLTARDGATPTSRTGSESLPDLKDAEAVQKFFLEEIQLGEELLAQGEYEKGVDHLTNAIAVCGQPQQLLQVLQQTLPSPVFQMLLTKLPTISQRIVSVQSLAEDDVE